MKQTYMGNFPNARDKSRKRVAKSGLIPYLVVMASEKKSPAFSGKRRSVDELPGLRYPRVWPLEAERRQDEFDFWHSIAMQILNANGASFRLLATIAAALDRQWGQVHETDEELAEMAGGCSIKTISRDLADYKRLGLLVVEYGWRESKGKMVRKRTIYTAIPSTLPAYVKPKFR